MSGSVWSAAGGTAPNPVRIDEVDLAILGELEHNARMANNVLAHRVGLAPSTCLGRVKALTASGIIEGFETRINAKLLGVAVSAMISVIVAPHARDQVLSSAQALSRLAEVRDVYVLGGTPDLLVHASTRSIDDLRRFVATHLGANRAFSSTQTSIVFEHLR